MMVAQGELLAGDFEVKKLLKKGGMSVIYLGAQKSLSRAVIIKILETQGKGISPQEMEKLFAREANILRSLSHQQIPSVYAFFTHRGNFCIVMEFIEGDTLEEFLRKKRPPLTIEETLEIGSRLCDVILYLHSRNPPVIFKDLKPENVILKGDMPYLIDFGIAKVFDFKVQKDSIAIGSQGYAAPEQYGGRTDNRSDIFSLGRLLYYLVTGIPGERISHMKAPESPVKYNALVPRELEEIILKAAHPSPGARFQSVQSLKNALEKIHLIKTFYEKCKSCGQPVLEGHFLCSNCGLLRPPATNPSGRGSGSFRIIENPEIERLYEKGSRGDAAHGHSYYLAEFFGRTLGFESLMTVDRHNIDQLPHQVKVVKKVLRSMRGRALLADEVGLGKTIEAGMVMEELAARGLARKALIITPPHLLTQWQQELKERFGREAVIFDSHKNMNLLRTSDYILISIDTASRNREIREKLEAMDWDLIILDEAHWAKNRATERWKFLSSLSKNYILLLTATPLHNNLIELFNLITLLRPGHLKDEAQFTSRYIDSRDPRKPKNVDELKNLLSEVMVRTRRSHVMVRFPQREASTINVIPTAEERSLYEDVTDFIRRFSARISRKNKFLLMVLQQRLTSSPRAIIESIGSLRDSDRWDFSPGELEILSSFIQRARAIREPSKARRLLDVMRQLNEKAVIFTDHVPTQEFLRDYLGNNGYQAELYRGSLREKSAALKGFSEGSQALIVSKTGAEGLNLHFYSHIIINYDLPWNPMRLEQRIGRLQRLGQSRKVLVFNFAQKDSIEEVILEVLEEKVNLFALAIGQIDLILGLCLEDRNFDDLIWDLVIKSKDRNELRENMIEDIGDAMAEKKKEAEYIEKCNQFLPSLDDF